MSARILGSIGAQDCIENIAKLYHEDPNEEVRRAAATALKAFGEYSIGIFVNDISSPDAKIRDEAFTYVKSQYALAAGELEKVWEKGDEATKRNVETIVKEAVNNIVITKSKSRSMKGVLQWDPFRKDWPRRIGAIEIFGKRIEPAIDTLIEIVTNESEQQIPRCRAALLMTDLGGGDNVLRALLKLRDSEDPELLKEAFTDIGQLRNPKAIKILTADLDKFPEYRFRILRALGDIGDPEALDTLFDYLKKGNDTEKKEAIVAISKIRDEKAYKFLIEIVNDKKSGYRKMAINALNNEKAKAISADIIYKIFEDPSDPNRKDAEEALQKMKDGRLANYYAKIVLDAKGEKPCSEELRNLWMLGDRRATAIFMDVISDPRKYDYVEAVRGMLMMNYLDFQFPMRVTPPADINVIPEKDRPAKLAELLKKQQLDCLKKIVEWWEKNKQNKEYHIEGLK
jgi:HEAT repeat protein